MRIAILALLWLIAQPLAAQSTTPPLIVMANGVVYRYSEGAAALEPLAFCAGDYAKPPLVLAPDGTRIAFRVTALEQAGQAELFAPSLAVIGGLVTCDLALETRAEVAPRDGRFVTSPAWSPDGVSLTWIEYDAGDAPAPRLMRHDLTSGETTPIAELPAQARYDALSPSWGLGGIALLNTPTGDAQAVEVYDPNTGALLARHEIVPFDRTPAGGFSREVVSPFVWVDDAGVSKVLIREQDSAWTLLDPVTNSTEPGIYPPEVYLLSDPDGAALVYYAGVSIEDVSDWRLRLPDDPEGANLLPITYAFALTDVPPMSGDGAFVTVSESTIIFRPADERFTDIPLPDVVNEPIAFAWQPYAWRIWRGQSWVELYGLSGAADG
jgi:hypothetical protein